MAYADIIYTHTSLTVIYSCIYDHLQEESWSSVTQKPQEEFLAVKHKFYI